jgi:hypothetical protein
MVRDAAKLRERVRLLLGIDLRSLALFRITCGLLLLVDLAGRARLLEANYTDFGAHPRAVALAYREPNLLPSLHWLAGSLRVEAGLFAVAAAVALLLLVGWRTRIATVLSWFLLVSLHARNELVLDGGDHLLRHLLFWSMFLPLGARWSLDARQRASPLADPIVFTPASAALLLQVASVFLVTGLAKTGPEWTDGTAIRYAIDRRWWTLPVGDWLLAHRWLPELLTPLVRWGEILGPLALFSPLWAIPLRALAIVGLLGLLTGLGLGLRLNLFPFIAGSGLLLFLPPACWDALGRRSAVFRRIPEAPPAPRAGWRRGAATLGHGAVLALLLLLAVWMNARTLDEALSPPPALARIGAALRIEQGWKMYAPSPKHVDVWFEHRGRLANGAPVDLDRATGGAGWAEVERAWRDYRFQYQLQKLAATKLQPSLRAYAAWLCRRWNLDRTGGSRLEHVSVVPIVQPIAIRDEPEQPARAETATTALCPL